MLSIKMLAISLGIIMYHTNIHNNSLLLNWLHLIGICEQHKWFSKVFLNSIIKLIIELKYRIKLFKN